MGLVLLGVHGTRMHMPYLRPQYLQVMGRLTSVGLESHPCPFSLCKLVEPGEESEGDVVNLPRTQGQLHFQCYPVCMCTCMHKHVWTHAETVEDIWCPDVSLSAHSLRHFSLTEARARPVASKPQRSSISTSHCTGVTGCSQLYLASLIFHAGDGI